MKPRCKYDPERAQRVLDLCSEPKTAAQIVAALGSRQARFAVHNLVKRGELQNLNAGKRVGTPGLFVVAKPRERSTDRGALLASVWGAGAPCAAGAGMVRDERRRVA